MISSKIIAHSVDKTGDNHIITFELEYPRFIHAEFMTHRLLSRNAASSRAIPVPKMIEHVRNDTAMPYHWGANQKGMQAGSECDAMFYIGDRQVTREKAWEIARDNAIEVAEAFSNARYHKQIVNRLLEPFQHMKTVVTATNLNNFFHLRNHKDAQPEIRILAEDMYENLSFSEPVVKDIDEWHLPYVQEDLPIDTALKVSASCCAQVSYRTTNQSVEVAEKIYDKLVNSKPVHCYDDQTEVLTYEGFKFWKDVTQEDRLGAVDHKNGNFIGFYEPSNLVSTYYNGKVYSYNQRSFELVVTENHKLYGQRVRNSTDRKFNKATLFEANTPNSNKAKYKTAGESQFIAPLTTNGTYKSNDPLEYYWGCLFGMFVGDGIVPKDGSVSVIIFHLKKRRKIEFIKNICNKLNLPLVENKNRSGSYTLRINNPLLGYGFRERFYTETGEKKLDDSFHIQSQERLEGLFDGLKNSDGSVKRNTMVYSTSSEVLKNQFEVLCSIGGFGSCYVDEQTKDGGPPNYRLMVRTRKTAIVNDSRTPDTRCNIRDYSGMVYCATVPGNVLIVRRNGKVCLSGNSSPFEHQATPHSRRDGFANGITHRDLNGDYWSGNFKGWIQHRQLIPNHHKEG